MKAAPSLAAGSRWGRGAAKLILGRALQPSLTPVERLRKALALNSTSVISLFKTWDVDGDGRVSRREFIKSLPRLSLGDERFEAKDADELFTLIDRDKSGWVDYKELEQELRREARNIHALDAQRRATRLLDRKDVIIVSRCRCRCPAAAHISNRERVSR